MNILIWGLILGAIAGVIEAVPIYLAKNKKKKEKNSLIALCVVNRTLIGLFVATTKIILCKLCGGPIWNGALVGLLISLSVAMQLNRYPQVLIPGIVEGGVIAWLLTII